MIGIARRWSGASLTFRAEEYVITTRRIIQAEGVINKRATDSSLEKINDAVLVESMFGRIFGFGDLDILTASESGIEQLRMLRDAKDFKKAMLEAKHELELELSRPTMPPPLRAAAPGPGAGAPPGRAAPRARRRPPRWTRPTRSRTRSRAWPTCATRAIITPRGVRGEEGGAARPALGRRARYHTRDPRPPLTRPACKTIVINVVMIAIFLGIAFPVHEFAHAAVAYLRGDATAKLFGRLTLNPIVHFDPIGGLMTVISILLGGFLFGWAKPTPVNPANLRDRRNGEVLVALAGPASNLVMAVLGAFVFRRARRRWTSSLPDLVVQGIYLFVVFNVDARDLQPDPGPAARRLARSCSGSCRRDRPGRSGRSSPSTACSSSSASSSSAGGLLSEVDQRCRARAPGGRLRPASSGRTSRPA